jgi:cobalt/nickel transport system permease protein
MGIYHAIIGVIEGIVTVAAIYLIMNVRPDLVDTGVKPATGAKGA